jgi:hypothetical protein
LSLNILTFIKEIFKSWKFIGDSFTKNFNGALETQFYKMQIIFTISFLCVWPFSFFVFGEDSPIATYVDQIDNRISYTQKRSNTVKFLKDSKHWKNLLENAVSLDLEGTKAVVNEVNEIIVPDRNPKSKCICEPPNRKHGGHRTKFLEEASILNNMRDLLGKDETKDQFKVLEYVEQVAKALGAYDFVYCDPSEQELVTKKSIGDVAESLSIALKLFKSGQWDKLFYEKLIKAAENKPESDRFWYYFAAFVAVLLVAGVAIFLILFRRKRQASNLPQIQKNQVVRNP